LVTVSYFRNRSSNLLVGLPLSAVTGFTSVPYNLPAVVRNTGWELETVVHPINRPAFRWSSSLNVTFLRNKLLHYPGLGSSIYAQPYMIGQPLSMVKTYISQPLHPQSPLFAVKDINGDGKYTIAQDAV